MWGSSWHGWIFGPLMMILMLALVVGAVVLLIRWVGGNSHHGLHSSGPGQTPLDILEERFARGEIDKEEFEERRGILEKKSK
jgi:putative membrane protein